MSKFRASARILAASLVGTAVGLYLAVAALISLAGLVLVPHGQR